MRDGYRSECKSCNLAAAAERYDTDDGYRQRMLDRVKRWQQDNPERVVESRTRRRDSGQLKLNSRRSHLKRTFGITPEEYDGRLAEQGGGCAVCGRPPKDGKSLHVDHDHDTGYVRGLLCFSCNAALGHFQDDLDRIDAALIYVATKRRVSALRLAL